MYRVLLSVVLAVALVAAFGLVACAPAPTAAPEQPTASPPATLPSGQEPGAPDAGASGDGQALLETKCTMCHTLDRVDNAKKSRADWESTIARMEKNGLVISADEKSAIIDFLAQRDGM